MKFSDIVELKIFENHYFIWRLNIFFPVNYWKKFDCQETIILNKNLLSKICQKD